MPKASVGRPPQPPIERLMKRITITPGPMATPCWLTLPVEVADKRYTLIQIGGRRGVLVGAHRFAYEHFVGPIPAGLHLDHLCRRPACVNPQHLEPVTPRVNTLRGTSPTARATRTDLCKRGHSLATAYVDSRGSRHCRECRKARQ